MTTDPFTLPHQQCATAEPHVGHRHVNGGPRGGCGLPEWCSGVADPFTEADVERAAKAIDERPECAHERAMQEQLEVFIGCAQCNARAVLATVSLDRIRAQAKAEALRDVSAECMSRTQEAAGQVREHWRGQEFVDGQDTAYEQISEWCENRATWVEAEPQQEPT